MAQYKVGLSHFIREQLAEVVLNLPDFDLTKASEQFIVRNSASWAGGASGPSFVSLVIKQAQQTLGLINYKKYTDPEADILFANGGFLITDKPYVTYIEKQTQIFGYSAKNYNKIIGKYMLTRFLRDPHLKKIFFRSHTALEGMLNTQEFGPEIKALVQQKGVGMYPPLGNPEVPDLKRFTNPRTVKFLFVSSIFYEKGGKELLHAFDRLSRELPTAELHLVTKINKLTPEDTAFIQQNKAITVYDAAFSRDELFKKFFNQCHVFVYPTYSDSFSAVINEAISAYLPVITSDFYSIPERVHDGVNGFVFKSPFPNYDAHMVIRTEHFKSDSDFPRLLPEWQAGHKLQYVEDFLYDKMLMLARSPHQLSDMATAAKKIYDTELDPALIRSQINTLFWQSLDK